MSQELFASYLMAKKRGADQKQRKKRAKLTDAEKADRRAKIAETKCKGVGQPKLFAKASQVLSAAARSTAHSVRAEGKQKSTAAASETDGAQPAAPFEVNSPIPRHRTAPRDRCHSCRPRDRAQPLSPRPHHPAVTTTHNHHRTITTTSPPAILPTACRPKRI